MNWKSESKDELREYTVRHTALRNIPEELASLKVEQKSLGGSTTSSIPVKGGGSAFEDRQINLIVKREKLETALRQTRVWIAKVEKGLSALNDEERLILERFYISPAKGNVDRLCEELNIEKSAVYLRKDAALRRYTLARYGCIEV